MSSNVTTVDNLHRGNVPSVPDFWVDFLLEWINASCWPSSEPDTCRETSSADDISAGRSERYCGSDGAGQKPHSRQAPGDGRADHDSAVDVGLCRRLKGRPDNRIMTAE